MLFRRLWQSVQNGAQSLLIRPLSTSVITRTTTVQAPFVVRFLENADWILVDKEVERQQKNVELKGKKKISFRTESLFGENGRLSAMQPLKSLGGLNLMNYMALEATEGHFQMLKTWKVDLANDLTLALDRMSDLSKELTDTKDRMEDLEIMVTDLTNFVEFQKDEIARLKVA